MELSKVYKTMKSVSDMISRFSNAVYQQSREDKNIGKELKDINTETFNYLSEENKTNNNRAFLGFLIDTIQGNVPSEKETKIKELTTKVDLGKIDGYFPTPNELAEELVNRLGYIRPNDTLLEPSAGKGSLIEAVKKEYPEIYVDCFEVNHSLKTILELKKLHNNLYHDDFLSVSPQDHGKTYDKIVMNPPFENKRDIDHITHALKFLKEGGRLVAIASAGVLTNSDRKSVAFRELVEDYGGSIEPAPQGAFKKADRATAVNTIIVEIEN
jgi:predicted RNA methylase